MSKIRIWDDNQHTNGKYYYNVLVAKIYKFNIDWSIGFYFIWTSIHPYVYISYMSRDCDFFLCLLLFSISRMVRVASPPLVLFCIALHWHRSISRFLSIFCHFTSMWSMYKYLCAEKSRIKILFRISTSITHTASFDIFNDDDDDVENYSSIPKYMYIIWVKISDAIPVANRRKGKRNEMKRKLIDLVYIRSVSRV